MLSLRRFILCVCAVFFGLAIAVCSPAAAAPAMPTPSIQSGLTDARSYDAPGTGFRAWLTPGPQPELWLAGPDGLRLVMHGQNEQFSALQWASDGRSLALFAAPTGTETFAFGRWWVIETGAATAPRPVASQPAWVQVAAEPMAGTPQVPNVAGATAALQPPAAIRVYHSPYNSCRDLPVGTITTLPFEEYVARVLPAEVYSSWPAATLRAQAMAIRTYAWYQILHAQSNYDVTDSTSYQYMCDTRYTSTDNATSATAGVYLAYDGQVILAQYSAENSDPTLSGNLPYLQPVMDPVGLGRVRNGHGHGLSQWGAQRWAALYGWNEVQILAHYYTGAQIVDPTYGDPLLSLVAPWPGAWLTGAAAYLNAHAGGEAISALTFQVPGLTLPGSPGAIGWTAEWLLPDQLGGPLTITAGDGPSGDGAHSGSLTLAGVDRAAPGGQINLPASIVDTTVSVPIAASDTGGSGLALLAIGADRQVKAADFVREAGDGGLASDAETAAGTALRLPSTTASQWQAALPADLATNSVYQAYARLRIPAGQSVSTARMVRAELYDRVDGELLGFIDLRPGDWREPGAYQEFPIDFWMAPDASGELGVRLITYANGEVTFDRLRVLPAPQTFTASPSWTFEAGSGPQTVVAKVIDGAGNPSDDLLGTTQFVDLGTPGAWQLLAPTGWITDTLQPSIVARVVTTNSVAVTSAAARFSTDTGNTWSGWLPVTGTAIYDRLAELSLAWPGGEGGGTNQVQLRATDGTGWVSLSPVWPVQVDLQAPTVQGGVAPAPNAAGWITSPVTVQLSAQDGVSGVGGIWYLLENTSGAQTRQMSGAAATGGWTAYTAPLALEGEGQWHISYRAQDNAGHYSAVPS